MRGRRTELLTIRMTMRERGEAQTVAQAKGRSVAELVREFFAAELAALSAATATPRGGESRHERPHGRTDEEHCDERGCRENVFKHRGASVRVVRLHCDSCGTGTGVRGDGRRYGSGLSARTLRQWRAAHPPETHETHWKMIAIGTGLEILGGGAPPVTVEVPS